MRPRRRGSARLATALATLAAVAGCHRADPPATPVLRVAGTRPPSVALEGVWRPVVARATRLDLLVRHGEPPADGRRRDYDVAVPGDIDRLVATALVHAAGMPDRWQTTLVPVAHGAARIAVDVADVPAGRPFDVAIAGYPAPALAARDVTTASFAVPRAARLELAAGVQREAWDLDVALRFAVAALDGEGERELWTATLDPARRPADRRWLPAVVPLDALAGRTIRLRFTVRPLDAGDARTSLPLWGDPVVVAPGTPFPHPNVLLVSLDTLRADAVGAYGAARATTPRLDRELAAAGTMFSHAVAPFPMTLPSHLSLLTGLYHRHHGVRRLGEALAPAVTTLAESFREAGYATAAFTEDGFLIADSGVARGFELYEENAAPKGTGHAFETFGRGTAWIRAHGDRPWLVFLHTYQVHAPYLPPEAYQRLFVEPGTTTAGIDGDRLHYRQSARVADDALGGVLDAIPPDTLVVLFSDHGEEFLEHGQRFHGYQLFEETLHVPLVVRWPGRVPAGRRVDAPVSLVDVMPTVLYLADLPARTGLDGRNLAPLFASGPTEERAAVSEAMSAETVRTTDLVSARTARAACTRHVATGALDCYDLIADPGEHARLPAGDEPAPLVRALDAFLASPVGPIGASGGALDDATRRRLEALGYVVGPDGAVGPAPGD
jgi:arylsulfatase A-like enzyme